MTRRALLIGLFGCSTAYILLKRPMQLPNTSGLPYQELPKLPYKDHPNKHFITKIPQKIGIIGAGLSGLITAKILKSQGYDIEILDQQSQAGGVWTENYDQCGLQFLFSFYYLPDDPIKNAPELPKREYLKTWINQSIIQKFGLSNLLTLNSRVTTIDQNQDGSWNVHLDKGNKKSYDFLIVCTGVNYNPNIPDLKNKNNFHGKIIHSSQFKDAQNLCKGKNVIVVGGQKSACDILELAKNYGGKVMSVQRNIHWHQPPSQKSIFGIDMSYWLFSRIGTYFMLPTDNRFWFYNYCRPLVNWYYYLIERKLKEDMPEYLHPTMGYAKTRGILSSKTDIMQKFCSKEIKLVKGSIDELKPDGAIINGEFYNADLIVFATGFKVNYFGLEQEKDGIWMYRHTIIPEKKNLAFVGFTRAPAWSLGCSIQACWLAEMLRGKVKLPSVAEMRSDVENRKKITRSNYYALPHLSVITNGLLFQDPFLEDMGIQIRRKSTLFEHFFGHFNVEDYKTVITHRV